MKYLEQGAIIKLNFNPHIGHEQAGYRPAMVISNSKFNRISDLILVVPITNTQKVFPTRVQLGGTKTTGYALCEQVKAIDITSREFKFEEIAPKELVSKVLNVVQLLISED